MEYFLKGWVNDILYENVALLSKGHKIIPLEIKSSATRNHESIEKFATKYSKKIYKEYLFSQKDVAHVGQLQLKPLYMLPFLLEQL